MVTDPVDQVIPLPALLMEMVGKLLPTIVVCICDLTHDVDAALLELSVGGGDGTVTVPEKAGLLMGAHPAALVFSVIPVIPVLLVLTVASRYPWLLRVCCY